MALCSSCKAPLSPDDKHPLCVIHRKCSRAAPCELDILEPKEYWDGIDAYLVAVQSSPHVSDKRASKSKKVSKGSVKSKSVKDKGKSVKPNAGKMTENIGFPV